MDPPPGEILKQQSSLSRPLEAAFFVFVFQGVLRAFLKQK